MGKADAAQRSEKPPARGPGGRSWRHYSADVELGVVGEAALRMFTDLGYHGTSIRLIAKEAAISVPGLYYHYQNKQEMLVDLLRRSNDDIMWRARAARDEGGGDPRATFSLLVENIILYMAHRRQMARLGREISSLEEPFRTEHVARRDELEDMLRREVAAAQKTGLFGTTDVREATRAVWAMCRGVADWYVPEGPKTPEQIAKAYVKFALSIVRDREAA